MSESRSLLGGVDPIQARLYQWAQDTIAELRRENANLTTEREQLRAEIARLTAAPTDALMHPGSF